jgi:hypothetical protein
MEWLIAIGITLYIIYRFWKIVLKWLLIGTVFMFIFLVVKIKTSFNSVNGQEPNKELISVDTVEKVIDCFE